MNKNTTTPDIFKLSSGLRCKPGDLAIVRESCYRVNIGRIVEVMRVSDLFEDGALHCHVRSVGVPLLARGESASECRGFVGEAACPDAALTPITGLPLEEETEVEDEVMA